MSICGCQFRCGCTAASLVSAVLAGIIGAFLQITAAIALTPVVFWVLGGIAVVYLGLLTLSVGRMRLCVCGCAALNTALLGILGTVFLSALLLLVTFPATSILGAIVVGLLFAAFTLLITATVCLIRAESGCSGCSD